MRKIMGFAVVAGLGCLSLGCAAGTSGGASGSGAAVPIVTYQCGEKLVRTESVPGGKIVKLTLPDGRTCNLTAVEGSSGTKFSDGQVTFVIKGKEASIEFAGDRKPITGCVTK
jgi:membrane-bound inhibitor of C-type lysozyme